MKTKKWFNVGSLFFLLLALGGVLYFFKVSLDPNSKASLDSTRLDPRIGTVLVSPTYPDRHTEEDMLVYGAKQAINLGFQSLEIWLGPGVCSTQLVQPIRNPYGLYQTTKWCNPDGKAKVQNLSWLAQQDDYKTVFNLPLKTYFLTLDTLRPKALNQAKVSKGDAIATAEEQKILYDDVYELTKYLATNYGSSDKTFVMVFGNELDWRITTKSDCGLSSECFDEVPDPISVKNAILWVNTASDAIRQATKDVKPSRARFYSSTEINQALIKSIPQSALTEVVPSLRTDLIGWSAYEAKMSGDAKAGLDKIAQYMPDSKVFGNKNVYISEVGFSEQEYSPYMLSFTQSALQWGVPYFVFWELYDTDCTTYMPSKESDCRGFWIVKPNGKLSKMYNILSIFTEAGLLPSPSVPPVLKASDSIFVSQNVPTNMKANNKYHVDITLKNIGKTTWTTEGHFLGFTGDPNNDKLWTKGRDTLSSTPVKSLQNTTFSFDIVAPEKPGTYKFQWQMLNRGIEWFGEKTPLVNIKVIK